MVHNTVVEEDLCSVIDALLDGENNHQIGRKLLIALANENNLTQVTKYIRTKLGHVEARIVHAYLRRHPDRFEEFVNAIPAAEQMQNVRTDMRLSPRITQ